MTHWSWELPTEAATQRLAEVIAAQARPGDLVLLTGPLGAGKTYFAGAFCRALGLDADEPVTSPTYALINEYPTTPPVRHADLYRLRSEDDVLDLGLLEQRGLGAVLLVEWGAPYEDALGGEALELTFTLEPRTVSIISRTDRAQDQLKSIRAAWESGS